MVDLISLQPGRNNKKVQGINPCIYPFPLDYHPSKQVQFCQARAICPFIQALQGCICFDIFANMGAPKRMEKHYSVEEMREDFRKNRLEAYNP